MGMDSREIIRRTLTFESPERIPRHLWLLPWAEKKYPEVIEKLRRDFPDDIVSAPAVYSKPLGTVGDRYSSGTYVDEWGCIFDNRQSGTIGIIREPLVKEWGPGKF